MLAPITLACVFLLPTPYFILFCSAVMLIGAWEWGSLMGVTSTSGRIGFVALIIAMLVALHVISPADAMWQSVNGQSLQLADTYYGILFISALWWLISLFLIFTYPKSASFWQQNLLIRALIGVLSLVPAWVAFIAIRTLHIEQEGLFYFGAYLLFASLLIVWAADIGAYFSGKKFGKHKLMPHVSPNKTIEGFVGGLIWVAVLVVILNACFDIEVSQYPLYLAIAVLTAVISAVGDLNESMFKRVAGVKDSGTILPGHGGILDRIDSLVAATPVFILLYSTFLV